MAKGLVIVESPGKVKLISKYLGKGISELRIDWGPGYRVYYARKGSGSVLLLCGGDKRKQSSDIRRAGDYLTDYQERAQER